MKVKPEEVTMREKIKGIVRSGLIQLYIDGNNSVLLEIVDELTALFQQQLEQERKEMKRTVRGLETVLEGINHELLDNLMESYCKHQKKLKESCSECGRFAGGRK